MKEIDFVSLSILIYLCQHFRKNKRHEHQQAARKSATTMSGFFSFVKTAIMGSFLYIHDLYDFVDFVGNVNSGTNYSGTTVVLETDIDFSDYIGGLSPIGADEKNSFMGTFDGKNHTFSNLALSSSSGYVGLFGYTRGATIRNIKLDSTCSVSSDTLVSDAYIGGLVGYCTATKERGCAIEGCMSAARVTFAGNTLKSFERMGGLIGECKCGDGNGCTIINSMSYGAVKHEGVCEGSIIGGICGLCKVRDSDGKCAIRNSGTYGSLIHSGTVNDKLIMGGVLGVGVGADVENCVCASSITSGRKKMASGGVAGVLKKSTITRVFWEDPQGELKACGDKDKRTTLDGTSSNPSKMHESTVDALNRYREKLGNADPGFDWVLLHMNGGTANNITRDVILTHRTFAPIPLKSRKGFFGWCEAPYSFRGCVESPISTSSVKLYAKYW